MLQFLPGFLNAFSHYFIDISPVLIVWKQRQMFFNRFLIIAYGWTCLHFYRITYFLTPCCNLWNNYMLIIKIKALWILPLDSYFTRSIFLSSFILSFLVFIVLCLYSISILLYTIPSFLFHWPIRYMLNRVNTICLF